MGLEVQYRGLAELAPYARNARTHSDAQIQQIRRSIREFGFTNPVLIDSDGGIIAGHGRVMAAKAEGLDRVPTITLGHLSEEQRRALVIADNQIALNAGWNIDVLKQEIGLLVDAGFDPGILGFDDTALTGFLNSVSTGQVDEDDAPEPPKQPASRPGDVWILGPHRVACGSSTDEHTVTAALAGQKPNLMVTDPPYGVEYDAASRGQAKNGDGTRLSTGKGRAKGKVENDDQADWRDAWALFPGSVAYVWHAGLQAKAVFESLVGCGFTIRSQIVWSKSAPVVSRGDYHWQHEACWYVVRAGQTAGWVGGRKQTTIWQIDKSRKSETGHSTQKPVECLRRPILNNSAPGQVVYDPFLGSGTTLMAAETAGRVCIGIELNPAYVDVAVRRWQEFTGKAATLEGDGRSFENIHTDRIGAEE